MPRAIRSAPLAAGIFAPSASSSTAAGGSTRAGTGCSVAAAGAGAADRDAPATSGAENSTARADLTIPDPIGSSTADAVVGAAPHDSCTEHGPGKTRSIHVVAPRAVSTSESPLAPTTAASTDPRTTMRAPPSPVRSTTMNSGMLLMPSDIKPSISAAAGISPCIDCQAEISSGGATVGASPATSPSRAAIRYHPSGSEV